MFEKIIKKANSLSIHNIGFTTHENENFIVCLFPYFIGEFPKANLAKYAFFKDYHLIVKKYLNQLISYIEELFPGSVNTAYVDISPYNEKLLAKKAGLGFIGQNNLLITKEYGSFVFIGIIKTDIPLPGNWENHSHCKECGTCVKNCPAGALTKGFDRSLCLSDISQQKGDLTLKQIEIFQKSSLILGCDICQNVCPHNQNIKKTPIPDFYEDVKTSLFLPELEPLSNKEFKENYGDRAFSWRGKNVLLRNLRIIFRIIQILLIIF